MSYANQYTKPFNEISGVITELQNAIACAARIFELIEEEAQAPDAENAKALTDAQGNVQLEHVYFQYVPDKKLIQDFNLTVKPGQRVAIVGPTGCGKTTIINLLMRFYDVDQGGIRVDGRDIRDLTRGVCAPAMVWCCRRPGCGPGQSWTISAWAGPRPRRKR